MTFIQLGLGSNVKCTEHALIAGVDRVRESDRMFTCAG